MIAPGRVLYRARRWVLIVCVAVWIGAFVVTHMPRDGLPGGGMSDSTLHGLGYFGLGLVFYVTLAAHRTSRKWRFWTVVGVLAVYAAVDEITQPLAAHCADVRDWLADVAGAAVAALICHMLARLRRS